MSPRSYVPAAPRDVRRLIEDVSERVSQIAIHRRHGLSDANALVDLGKLSNHIRAAIDQLRGRQ